MHLEEFDQRVSHLNEELGLNLTAHRKYPLSNSDGIARDLYFQLRKQYKADRQSFDQCVLEFKNIAYHLLKNWVYKPLGDVDTLPSSTPADRAPLGVRRGLSEAERAELYERLRVIVHGEEQQQHHQPTASPARSKAPSNKRKSDEYDGGRSKRSWSSRERPHSQERPSLMTRVKSQHPDISMSLRHRVYSNASASTSRNSFYSTTFSVPPEPEQTPCSSQDTTVNDRKFIGSQEFQISSTEEQALVESFSILEGEGKHDESTQPCTQPDEPICRSFELGPRFQGIWPALPANGLNHAELGVLWETTRAALHCDMDLRDLDGIEPLDLDTSSENGQEPLSFLDQKDLYAKLRKHPVFSNRSLPSFSSAEAWDISLGKEEGHKADHVAVFKAELLYNPRDSSILDETQQGTKAFQVKLHPLEIRLGHRLDRRFGFDRFLELVVPVLDRDNAEQAEMALWLTGEQAFLGRRWRPFFIKKAKKTIKDKGKDGETIEKQAQLYVFHMFAVDGNSFHGSKDPDKAPPSLDGAFAGKEAVKCTIRGLLDWTLNLSDPRNTEKPALKLFSRLALSLSRSNPGKVLEKHQIINEPEDIVSSHDHETVMNDGLGIMSRALARDLAEKLSLTDTPNAFQGRLGSAKGVWFIDVNEDVSDSSIWIKTYPSQRKWHCDFEDQQHRTFEVKNFPLGYRVKSTSLNLQFIPVLEHGAVDQQKMRDSMENRLKFCVEQETTAETEALDDPRRLLKLVYKAGPGRDLTFKGGLPSGDDERAYVMLLSGLTPRNKTLADLLWKLRKGKTEELKKRMKIQIPCSAYLLMVADMWGVLEPGEVHISFSERFSAEGSETLGIPGYSDTMVDEVDVLVARSPAHLPSDIQRLRAVSRPRLRKLKNVIVFSTKGSRPPADYLSGGDYDGDMAWVCWDQDIVTNFQNSNLQPPKYDFLGERYLQKDRVIFEDLQRKYGDVASYDEFLYKGMRFVMQDDMLGICTKHKERISYALGVDHKKTMLESVLLGELVDQAKAGITFNFDSWRRFLQEEKYLIPDTPQYENDKASDKWLRDVRRGKIKPHVLDYLKFNVADGIINATLTDFRQALFPKDNPPKPFDQDLTGFYHEVSRWGATSRTGNDFIKTLEKDIRELSQLWGNKDGTEFEDMMQLVHDKFMEIEPFEKIKSSSRTINCLNDAWMRYSLGSRQELEDPGGIEWRGQLSRWTLLKASTLFALNYSKSPTMCWHVAGRQLLHLKASVVGARSKETIPMLVVPEMFNVLRPDNVAIKRLAAKQAADASVLALDEVNNFDEEGTVIDDA